MTGQIRMTPDTMRARANEYRTEANNVNSVIAKMDALLSALQSEWEGNAADSYAARYEELKPAFVKAEDLINEIAKALDASANYMEESDQNIANSWRG